MKGKSGQSQDTWYTAIMIQPGLFDEVAANAEEMPEPSGISLSMARPYQLLWSDAVLGTWRTHERCMGVAATGVGKTFGAALIIDRILKGELSASVPELAKCRPAVLFINQRVDLVQQVGLELAGLLNTEVEIEQGDARALGGGGVVSACLQSLSTRRLYRMGRDRFQAIVFDECHRYGPRNQGLQRVLNAFDPAVRKIGLTATPDRGDGIGLAQVFHRIAFEFGIWQAVEAGYLVRPYMAYEYCGDIKLEGLPTDANGDFDSLTLGARMCEAGPVAAVVAAAIKWSNYDNGRGGRRPTVVCCAGVPQSKIVAMQLNEWDKRHGTGRAAVVYGSQDWGERQAALRAFREGSLQYLCHFDVLTEGFDSDQPKVLVNGRPCKSRWVFAQNVGRILRPLKEVARQLWRIPTAEERRNLIAGSSKPGVMVVDVAGTDHKLTVDLLSVFNAPDTDPYALNIARERQRRENKGKAVDPVAEIAKVTHRDQKLADTWRGIKVDCDLTTKMVDPFDVFDIVPGREPRWLKGKRPTVPMIRTLLKAGFSKGDVDRMTFHSAKKMLDVVMKRRDAGLSTFKQAALLRKFGLNGSGLLFEEASRMIDKIKRDGWKVS